MNFFPVVGRELQIAARKPLTYRLRVVTVFICLAFCARAVFQYSSSGGLGTGQGINLFLTLTTIAFLFSSFSGVFVCSDCLSREKRDGTLGLLFLTDLRPVDVVFGKLCAYGLNLFYGLLAFVPILAMTLQMGGVTLTLVGKTVLMLLNCMFLSISIGTFISSISKDERKALWASIGLLLTIYIGPFIVFEFMEQDRGPDFLKPVSHLLLWLSPLTSMNGIVSGFFGRSALFGFLGVQSGAIGFYASILIPHLLAWFLLYRSGRAIAKVTSGGGRSTCFDVIRERWHYFLFGRGEKRRAHRQWLLDHHPMTWMVMREKLKLKYVWTLVISVMFIWVIGYRTNGEVMAESTVLMSLGMFVHFFLKIWVASEAASAIAEDRRTGALELVVTTPLGARGIVNGIFKASLLQFWKPVVLFLVLEIILVSFVAVPKNSGIVGGNMENIYLMRFQYMAGIGMLGLDMASIGWVAIWYALTTGSSHKAIGRSVVWMLAVPWSIYFCMVPIWEMLWNPFARYTFAWIEPWIEMPPAHSSSRRDMTTDPGYAYFGSGRILFWCLIGVLWNYFYAWRYTRKRVLSEFQTLVSESSIQKKS